MKLDVIQEEKYTVLVPEVEKLDSTVSSVLKAEAVLLHGKGVNNMIIDLQAVKYIDSSGLSSILVANRSCKSSNGSLVLCNLQLNVQKLIDISQLNSVLNIVPTRPEAIEYIIMEDIEKNL
jgi:anti-anti-sigma factor